MKIAVLEIDKEIISIIKANLDSVFELTIFEDVITFWENANLFDLVLIGKKFANKGLINKISVYKIEIGLLNTENFDNENVAIVLDKDDLENIKDKLKYFEVKIRIKNLVKNEQKTLDDIIHITSRSEFFKNRIKQNEEFLKKIVRSTYYLEIKENIAILEIRDIIRQNEKLEIIDKLKTVNYRLATYFSLAIVSSIHLGILVALWRIAQKNNGKIVYWNKQNDAKIITVLKTCKLEGIIPIVNSFDEVKNKLKEIN